MNPIAGLTATGRRLHGPAADLVELISGTGYRHTAIQFHPEHRDHPAINSSLGVVLNFLESPMVSGLVELSAHDQEQGAFVYPTGQAWSVAEINRTYADFGEAPGVRAGLELMFAAGEILVDAAATGESHGVYSHGGLTPWRLLLKSDGQAEIIGYALPQVEILRFHSDPGVIPREDSFRYCPPERLEAAAEDLSSDLFALALIAFELMTGKPVYDGLVNDIRAMASRAEGSRRLFRFRDQLPRGVQELLKVCLRRDAPDRFSDGAGFMDALAAVLGSPEAIGPSLTDVMGRVARVPQRQGTPLQDGGATMMVSREKLAAMLGDEEAEAPARQSWKPPTRKRRVAPRSLGGEASADAADPQTAAPQSPSRPDHPAAAEAPEVRPEERPSPVRSREAVRNPAVITPASPPEPSTPSEPEPQSDAENLYTSAVGAGLPKWRRPARRPSAEAATPPVPVPEPTPEPMPEPAVADSKPPRRAASLVGSIVGGERRMPPPARRLPPRTMGSLDDPARVEMLPPPPSPPAPPGPPPPPAPEEPRAFGAERLPAQLPFRPSPSLIEEPAPPAPPEPPPVVAAPRSPPRRVADPKPSEVEAAPLPPPRVEAAPLPEALTTSQPGPTRSSLDEPGPAVLSTSGRRLPDPLAIDTPKGEPRLYRLRLAGKERRFRLPVDQPISEAVAKLVGTLLPLRLDAAGRLTGWYRLAQGGQRPVGNPTMASFDDTQPVDLLLVENRTVLAPVKVQTEGGTLTLRLALGTAVPAASLLDHICELLELPGGRWRLTSAGRALLPHELLDDCGPAEDLALVVER